MLYQWPDGVPRDPHVIVNRPTPIVACAIFSEELLLLLRRLPHKKYGGMLGMICGGIKPYEPVRHAIRRETKEESGLEIDELDFQLVGTYLAVFPAETFLLHQFALWIDPRPTIKLNQAEHDLELWVKREQVRDLHCIHTLPECVDVIPREPIRRLTYVG